jgi:hypothetical protein
MKTVVVLQSNYMPWKGYFDLIASADVCIFFDDVQYTKNDWRNRNKIKTPHGIKWLTIPAGYDLKRLIYQVRLEDHNWQEKHWTTICRYYQDAPYFNNYRDFFADLYLNTKWESLSELNQYVIKTIATQFLGITTQFDDSRRYQVPGRKLERLLNLLQQVGTNHYISGPKAQSYIEDARFDAVGIKLSYIDYVGYPEYPQFHYPFEHSVSVIDLLFHTGQAAPYYIWGWRRPGMHYPQFTGI